MKTIIAVALVAAVMGSAAHVASAARHPDFNRSAVALATRAAGRPVVIQCETAEALRDRTAAYALAYVVLDGTSVVHAGPTVCGWLAYPKSPTTYGQAILALIHEAMHLRYNSVDEALTERRALDAFPALVRAYFPGMNQSALLWGARRLDWMIVGGHH